MKMKRKRIVTAIVEEKSPKSVVLLDWDSIVFALSVSEGEGENL